MSTPTSNLGQFPPFLTYILWYSLNFSFSMEWFSVPHSEPPLPIPFFLFTLPWVVNEMDIKKSMPTIILVVLSCDCITPSVVFITPSGRDSTPSLIALIVLIWRNVKYNTSTFSHLPFDSIFKVYKMKKRESTEENSSFLYNP